MRTILAATTLALAVLFSVTQAAASEERHADRAAALVPVRYASLPGLSNDDVMACANLATVRAMTTGSGLGQGARQHELEAAFVLCLVRKGLGPTP